MPSEHALRLYRRMRPVAKNDELYGNSVLALAEALSEPTDPINDLVRAGADYGPWEPVVDPQKLIDLGHPWVLPWLGSIVGAGVQLPHLFEAEYNLVRNPGAEVNLTDWAASNATAARVTSNQRSGAGAFQMTTTVASSYHLRASVSNQNRYPAKEGFTYSAGAYVRAGNAGSIRNAHVAIVFRNTAGGIIQTATGVASPTTDLVYGRRIVEGAVAPAGTSHAEVQVHVAVAGAVGEITLVDDIMLSPTAVLPDYFDGATVSPTPDRAYSWVNAANASYSIQKRMQTAEEWAIEARDQILNRPLWRRGQPLYVRQQILKTLDHVSSLSHIRLLPRTSGPWRDTLVIAAARCPNQARTTAAAMAEKPAMREWTITYTDDYVIDEMTRLINNLTVSIDAAGITEVT